MENYTIDDLREIVKTLRLPDGCPWDRVQTHESMKQCLIEECYEVLEAIKNQDDNNLKEELGDVLFQVVMHSRIAEEREAFNFEDVVRGISEKMIRRHPHVFGNEKGERIEAGLVNWEQIKQEEKSENIHPEKGLLMSIPNSLPALIRAQKVLKKTEKVYGEKKRAAKSIDDAIKLLEELRDSIEENIEENKEEKVRIVQNHDIIGEIILEIVNIALEIQENAENSLTNIVETFINKHESNEDKKFAYPKI